MSSRQDRHAEEVPEVIDVLSQTALDRLPTSHYSQHRKIVRASPGAGRRAAAGAKNLPLEEIHDFENLAGKEIAKNGNAVVMVGIRLHEHSIRSRISN
jgi:hypothetical protein